MMIEIEIKNKNNILRVKLKGIITFIKVAKKKN